jgi:hypothetical protein
LPVHDLLLRYVKSVKEISHVIGENHNHKRSNKAFKMYQASIWLLIFSVIFVSLKLNDWLCWEKMSNNRICLNKIICCLLSAIFNCAYFFKRCNF